MSLLLINDFSKQSEIHERKATIAEATYTICKFKHIFAYQGLPESIILDNGLQFTASQFEQFCKSRGIAHLTIAPYQPGEVVNFTV